MPSDDAANGKWTFDCQVGLCSTERDFDHESEALSFAGDHSDHTGHFDFEITDPDGEVRY